MTTTKFTVTQREGPSDLSLTTCVLHSHVSACTGVDSLVRSRRVKYRTGENTVIVKQGVQLVTGKEKTYRSFLSFFSNNSRTS